MEFAVRHRLPGRLRLYVPSLASPTKLADQMLGWLTSQPGIRSARINFACASLVLEHDPDKSELVDRMLFFLEFLTVDQIRELVSEPVAGRPPASPQRVDPARMRTTGDYPLVLPSISLAMALSANPVMVAINTPLMIWNALPIARRAWKVLTTESRLNVDFLDTLAIGVSVGQSNLLTGGIITWLIRLGDWIRDLTAAGSKRAVSELLEFQGKTAWIVQPDGQVVSVSSSQLAAGDTVMVYPGELVPVDGEVLTGRAAIDQKTITGESLPVNRSVGERVFAGTVVREGQITVRADRVGTETTAGQIAQLVEGAPVGDTRMQNHAERFADRLVGPTLGLAVGTAVVSGDVNRFLSLVIVDYGTGIRVAAPTSVLASMTHAARCGIIIKSGGHMEKLAEIDTIVFDKTGTLTHGVPAVVDVMTYRDSLPPDRLLALACAAETRLKHPVAEALRAHARACELVVPDCDETEFRIGLGVEGAVDGHYVHVGSERFLRQSDVRVDHIAADRHAMEGRGYSCLYVAVDGTLCGLIPYADQIRPESREVIRTLHDMGIRETIMLTGDNAVVARAVGNRIGLTQQIAEMMPADKAEKVRELQRHGHRVAMVGDGINDSPALSYADVGIAMKHGADITHESADVVLMEDSLWKIVKAIEISRGAVQLIKQNYGIVAALNTIALGLALPGNLITPAWTAVLSNGSAILASVNGLRPMLRNR